MQISFHELENQVEILVILGTDDLVQLYDVRVIQLVQECDLPERALCIGRVLEGVEYLFEGQHLACALICHPPDVSVGSAADLLHQSVTLQ